MNIFESWEDPYYSRNPHMRIIHNIIHNIIHDIFGETRKSVNTREEDILMFEFPEELKLQQEKIGDWTDNIETLKYTIYVRDFIHYKTIYFIHVDAILGFVIDYVEDGSTIIIKDIKTYHSRYRRGLHNAYVAYFLQKYDSIIFETTSNVIKFGQCLCLVQDSEKFDISVKISNISTREEYEALYSEDLLNYFGTVEKFKNHQFIVRKK